MKRDKEVCPVCGSSECVDVPLSLDMLKLACPRCGCKDVIGMVRERSPELAVVDWLCRHCGFKWSGSCALPEEFVPKSVVWTVFERK